MPKTFSLRDAVYATICWFDVFSQPASAEEVHRYLFRRKANLSEVKKALYLDRRISHSLGFFFLQGRTGLVISRCQRHYRASKLWQRVLRYRFLFRMTPFLKFAAVGNTLAFGWPEQGSDIDIFIVADQKRLFTTRFLLTLFANLLGVRRHGVKIANRLCLSFFVADSAQDLSKLAIGQEDVYLAFWVASLVPVWKSQVGGFYRANAWVRKYFPNLEWASAKKIDSRRGLCRRLHEFLLGGSVGDTLEKILKHWQLRRARRKKIISRQMEETAVIISDTVLKFHEKDRRREFLTKWQKCLNSKSSKSQ